MGDPERGCVGWHGMAWRNEGFVDRGEGEGEEAYINVVCVGLAFGKDFPEFGFEEKLFLDSYEGVEDCELRGRGVVGWWGV